MVIRWSEADTLRLIKLYKKYNFLWDKSLQSYKNRVMRKQAYQRILEQMTLPNLTVKDIRNKIKNLRTYYHLEQRRIICGGGYDKVSTRLPWLNEFKSVIEINAETKDQDLEPDSLSESESIEEIAEELNFHDDGSLTSDTYVVSIKQEFLDHINEHDEKAYKIVGAFLEPANKKNKFHNKNFNRQISQRIIPNVENAVESEDPDEAGPSHKSKTADEFEVFAHNIALQLRKIPLDRALVIQVEIQSLIAKERIKEYKKIIDDIIEEESS